MIPSRRPPLPIWSGWPSSSESFSSSRTRPGSSDATGVELEAPRDLGDLVARQHPDRPLERLVLEHGADQRPQRGGAAADGDGLVGPRELHPLEEVVDVVAQLADSRPTAGRPRGVLGEGRRSRS